MLSRLSLSGRRRILFGIVAGLAGVGLWSLAHSPGSAPPVPPAPLGRLLLDFHDFQDGDLLFRRGTGNLSRIVLSTDPDSPYSHVGLVWVDGDTVRVIHATPGESIAETTPVQQDTLAEFLAPENAQAAAVARLVEPSSAAQIATRAAKAFFVQELPFDTNLDLATGSELYCTELVWKAYLQGDLDLAEDRLYRSNFLRSRLLLPSGLLKSPAIQIVHSFHIRGATP